MTARLARTYPRWAQSASVEQRNGEMKDRDERTTMIRIVLLIAMLLLAAPGSYAADGGNGWKTEFAPYLWLATVSGDFTTNGLPVSISESLSDVRDVLDFGGMLAVESTKNRAAILFDTSYVRISDGRSTSGLHMTESVTELAGAYAALVPEKTGLSLDVLAGLRYWYVENKVNQLGFVQSGSHDWIDQFLGARARWALTKQLLLVVRGDVGGFGVESKWSWNLVGTVQYSFSESFSAGVGYRALYGRYETGDFSNQFKYDATLAGPVVGANFAF
jgi:hypothetical protein